MSNLICATPENEAARLAALEHLSILDTDREPEFDELVGLASAICEVPMSLVSLIDSDRQWFKAKIGIETRETPRAVAFCAHTIQQSDLFVVEDAAKDERFAHNPLVTGSPQLRFYAGVPVSSPDGHAMGTLCVLDSQPKKLTNGQQTALRILGSQVSARLELRFQRKKLEEALRSAEESQARLRESEERFRTFMDHAPFVSFMKDDDGKMLYYSQQFADMFDISMEAWIGKTDFDNFPEQYAKEFRRHDLAVMESGVPRVVEETSESPDGSVHHWRSHKFRYVAESGVKTLGGVSVEITAELEPTRALHVSQQELEDANRRLATMVRTDALTGLHNRRGFDERLAAEFARARRNDRQFSVLILDVDNFKHRNDTYGHADGDETLKQLGMVLQGAVRAGDLVARYGGEEFVVLLPETGEMEATALAERLLRSVRDHSWNREQVTVSVGAASLHPAMRDEARLLALADEAMYAAKQSGKDRVINYASYLRQFSAGLPDLSAGLPDFGGGQPSNNSLPV